MSECKLPGSHSSIEDSQIYKFCSNERIDLFTFDELTGNSPTNDHTNEQIDEYKKKIMQGFDE